MWGRSKGGWVKRSKKSNNNVMLADSSSPRSSVMSPVSVVAEADSSGMPMSDDECNEMEEDDNCISTSGQVDLGHFRLVPNDFETERMNRQLHPDAEQHVSESSPLLPKIALDFGLAFAAHTTDNRTNNTEVETQQCHNRQEEKVSRGSMLEQQQDEAQTAKESQESADHVSDSPQLAIPSQHQLEQVAGVCPQGDQQSEEQQEQHREVCQPSKKSGELKNDERKEEQKPEECVQGSSHEQIQPPEKVLGEEQRQQLHRQQDEVNGSVQLEGNAEVQEIDGEKYIKDVRNKQDTEQVHRQETQNHGFQPECCPVEDSSTDSFCGPLQKRVRVLQAPDVDHHDPIDNKAYSCPLCNEAFELVVWLKEHVQKHKVNGVFHCSQCPKVFEEYASVRRHLRAFHGERKFVCHGCPKAFITRDKLRKHQVIHEDVKRFQCELCGKQFGRKDKLREHSLRLHSVSNNDNSLENVEDDGVTKKIKDDDTPEYSDDSKESRFKESSTETIDHARNGQFRCSECHVRFKRRGMLVNHVAKRHPHLSTNDIVDLKSPIVKTKKSFPCPSCDKTYLSSTKRKAHVLKKHPDEADQVTLNSFDHVGDVAIEAQRCRHCHKQYASNAKLMQHLRKAHENDISSGSAIDK